MFETLRWLVVAEAVGLAAFPIAFALFPTLRDRGWGFAKPLGLLLTGFAVWILSYAGILPNSAGAYWGVLGVAAAVGGYFLYRRRAEFRTLITREWRALLVGELLFLGFFAAWVAYRAYDPSIAGTEKPMDLLFLNASVIAPGAPPSDPWLSGQPVAYYYFGYWMMGGLSQMAAVPTSFAFNLSLGLLAGMAASGVFTLVYGMVRADAGRALPGMAAGIASAVLLLVAANLMGFWEFASLYEVGTEGFYEWLAIDGLAADQSGVAWRPDSHWWWWRASRVINTFGPSGAGLDLTIQEFPAFSFVLGDLHPHVMSIPFVLLGLGLVLNLWLSPEQWGFGWIRRSPGRFVALALVIGGLGFINAWDIATVGILLAIVALLKVYRVSARGLFDAAVRAAPAVIAVIGLGLLAYSPFYFGTFSSQVPLGAPIGAALYSSRPVHFLTVWGLPLLLVAPFLIAQLAGPLRARWNWLGAWMFPDLKESGRLRPPFAVPDSPLVLAAVLVGVPFVVWAAIHLAANDGARAVDVITRFASVLPLAALSFASMLALAHRARRCAADGGLFALVLVTLSLYLLYSAELLYVRDVFNSRMNTVFKNYYQVWIFLAAAGGYALHYWGSQHAQWSARVRAFSRTAALLAAVLVVGALYYPFAATFSKADGFSRDATLDGLAFIASRMPAERAAIAWLEENGGPDDTLLEAVGGSYTEYGRISAATGIPAVLGWPGHQRQWRGSDELYRGRAEDIEAIYTATNSETTQRLLQKYDVKYVFIGPREISAYPDTAVEKFDEIGDRVFDEDGTLIYEIIYRVQE